MKQIDKYWFSQILIVVGLINLYKCILKLVKTELMEILHEDLLFVGPLHV